MAQETRTDVEDRLDKIETRLVELIGLVSGQRLNEAGWHTTAEIAAILNKAEFTVREWCRLGRINAEKRRSGRGAHPAWVISHQELLRYRKEGLLPDVRRG